MLKRVLGFVLFALCAVMISENTFADNEIISYDELPETTISEFSIHSGVLFTDTKEEIFNKEQDAGFSPDYSDDKTALRTKLYVVAGIDNSKVVYRFDANELLYQAKYIFNYSNDGGSLDEHEEDFDSITELLINKYGNPVYFDGDGTPVLLLEYKDNQFITGYADYSFKRQLYDKDDLGLPRYNQWLIKAEDHYILIDHYVSMDWLKTSSIWYNEHILNYIYLDNITAESLIEDVRLREQDKEAKKEKQRNASDDL